MHVWSVLCRSWAVDDATNNIALDVLEQVAVRVTRVEGSTERVYSLPVGAHLVTLWAREDAEGADAEARRYRVVFAHPGGGSYVAAEKAIAFGAAQRLRAAIELAALPIDIEVHGPAVYWFHVDVLEHDDSWRRVASVPLEVTATIASE